MGVLKAVYNLGMWSFYNLAGVAGCFNAKAKKFYSGRKGLLSDITGGVKSDSPVIWIHCSSVGEFEQARPIIEWYRGNRKEYKILVTFFSSSGYELRKNYDKADWVYYLPVDTSGNVCKFLDAVKPAKAIFIKYEFWYNYLTELKRRGIETYLVSAIFRYDHVFFKWYGGFYRKMLGCFTALFVQDEQSARLLDSIGFHENVHVTGDTRFDRVYAITQKSRHFPIIEQFTAKSQVLVAGSTWEPDEKLLARVLKNFGRIKMVIAPHEITESRIAEVERCFQEYRCVRFSWFDEKISRTLEEVQDKIESSNVLIIDYLGILSSLYRYGQMAYIGGGFGAGIHNILEAATYSVPVMFGPNHRKFKEAVDLVKLGGAQTFLAENGLYSIIDDYIKRPESLKVNGEICGDYVKSHLGATDKVVRAIEKF